MSVTRDLDYLRKISSVQTQLQLHVSQQTKFKSTVCKILDYSEYKLKKLIKNAKNIIEVKKYSELLHTYVTGNVAIAWQGMKPVYTKVVKHK